MRLSIVDDRDDMAAVVRAEGIGPVSLKVKAVDAAGNSAGRSAHSRHKSPSGVRCRLTAFVTAQDGNDLTVNVDSHLAAVEL